MKLEQKKKKRKRQTVYERAAEYTECTPAEE